METKGYGGKDLHKTIRAITNDPENNEIKLNISGKVSQLATIEPSRVNLTGYVGESITRTVKIIPEGKTAFNILKITPQLGTDISVSVNEKDESGQKVYELTVANTKQTEGRYYDKIIILTDQSDYPPLTIVVTGYIRPKPEENKG